MGFRVNHSDATSEAKRSERRSAGHLLHPPPQTSLIAIIIANPHLMMDGETFNQQSRFIVSSKKGGRKELYLVKQ